MVWGWGRGTLSVGWAGGRRAKCGQDGWDQMTEDLGHPRRSLDFVSRHGGELWEVLEQGRDGIGEDPVEECEWGGRGGHLSRGQGVEQSWWGDTLFRQHGGQSRIVFVSGTERGPRALTRKGSRRGKGRFPGTPALREVGEWTTAGKSPCSGAHPPDRGHCVTNAGGGK